jgi:uncharacterized protein YndB with AHSA1/START domain
MTTTDLIATTETTIDAPLAKVWNALVDPAIIKHYMFGADVVSDWGKGRPITWKGEWKGKAYEDKGVILAIEPERRLQYTHFSPLSGVPDVPANYHTVTIDLLRDAGGVHVTLSQDNNQTPEAREHSEKNWSMMLTSLKQYLEA